MDLPWKSGEHQLRNQEVFYGKREQTDAGVSAWSGAAGAEQWPDATGDRGGSGHRPVDADAVAELGARHSKRSRGGFNRSAQHL